MLRTPAPLIGTLERALEMNSTISNLRAISLLILMALFTQALANNDNLSKEALSLCRLTDSEFGTSVAEIESSLGPADEIRSELVPNVHDERIHDLRVTMQFEGVSVELNGAPFPGKFFLRGFESKKELSVFQGLTFVGATLEHIKEQLGSPTQETETWISYVCDLEFPHGFTFHFSGGVVSSFRWSGYLD